MLLLGSDIHKDSLERFLPPHAVHVCARACARYRFYLHCFDATHSLPLNQFAKAAACSQPLAGGKKKNKEAPDTKEKRRLSAHSCYFRRRAASFGSIFFSFFKQGFEGWRDEFSPFHISNCFVWTQLCRCFLLRATINARVLRRPARRCLNLIVRKLRRHRGGKNSCCVTAGARLLRNDRLRYSNQAESLFLFRHYLTEFRSLKKSRMVFLLRASKKEMWLADVWHAF